MLTNGMDLHKAESSHCKKAGAVEVEARCSLLAIAMHPVDETVYEVLVRVYINMSSKS